MNLEALSVMGYQGQSIDDPDNHVASNVGIDLTKCFSERAVTPHGT